MKPVVTEIIAVGGELLADGFRDSNSDYLAGWATRNGFVVKFRSMVGDCLGDLEGAIRNSLVRAQLILITGGLGPTWDDVTRLALANALGRDLELNSAAKADVIQAYLSRGIQADGKEEMQALIPHGSDWLKNPVGIAPGIMLKTDSQTVVSFPGVPAEMKAMVDQLSPGKMFLFPYEPSFEFVRKIKIVGKRERWVERQLGDLVKSPGVEFSILPGMRWIELGLKCRGTDRVALENTLDLLVKKIRNCLGENIFCVGDENLEDIVGVLLQETGKTVSTAESCTGGLLGYRLTSVSGSSDYFHRGVITYSNEAKKQILGVHQETLATHGAVSKETAFEMARGVRNISGADLGISITGIAGPSGGSPEKPVGTVYLGLDSDPENFTVKKLFSGTREQVRIRAADAALDLIRRHLLKHNSSNT